MSKAIEGAALLAGAAAIFLAPAVGGFGIMLEMQEILPLVLGSGGVSMLAGSIAEALTSNRGMGITTRQPAAYRQIIYGEQRVGGVTIFESTTGSSHDQYNYVIVVSGHEVEAFVNLYLDGRQVFWQGSGVGYSVRNGYGFGGVADGASHTGPDGQQYSFGGTGHSGIYVEARYGDQSPGDVIGGLTANDPNWAADGMGNSPWVGGCAYFYLKVEFNSSLFPSPPEIRLTVKGKNDIFDIRTGSRGYTANSALIAADIISDPTFGIGDVEAFQESGSAAQLVAAANVCDEQVLVQALSATTATYESRYTCHSHYDTSKQPGDALDDALTTMGARISMPGGEWYIYPATWIGSSFSFGADALNGPVSWNPNRSQSELFNRVAGTFTAPNFPWSVLGDLYDANGFWNGGIQNNFNFSWQPTDYPAYAADTLHGFAADQYLEEDSGLLGPWSSTDVYGRGEVISLSGVMYKSLADANLNNDPATDPVAWVPYSNLLVKQLALPSVISVTQAQRLAKIALMRNRYQGTGTLAMTQPAFLMQACDVMDFNFAALGWTDKVLEIVGFTSSIAYSDDKAPLEQLQVNVGETDPSIYEWDPATEELTVYDVPASPTQQNRVPAPPTGMTLTSGPSTALVALDGVVTPRVEVQWTTPADALATQIQIQFQSAPLGGSPGPWLTAGYADISQNSFFVTGVVSGLTYDFRIRSIRASGAFSDYVEIDGFTVTTVLTVLTQNALAPTALRAVALSGTSAEIIVSGFTVLIGQATVTCLSAGPFNITGLTQRIVYYVYYIDPSFAGGAITPIATTDPADYLGKVGYFFIGSILTPAMGSGGGGGGGTGVSTPAYPTSFSDGGTLTTVSPSGPYSGGVATVSGYNLLSGATATGNCTWSGFPSGVTTIALNLYVTADSNISGGGTYPGTGCGVSLTSSLGTIVTDSSSALTGTQYSIAIPIGTDISSITLTGTVDPTSAGVTTAAQVNLDVSNIFIGP